MRSFLGCSRRIGVVGAVLFVSLLTGSVSQAQNACLAGKIKCVGGKDACVLGAYAGALKKGDAPDSIKIQKCHDKFLDPVKGCFAKLEGANKGPCITFGDAPALEFRVDAYVDDVRADLETLSGLDACAAAKEKCVAQATKCLLGVESTAAKKGAGPDSLKQQKCRDKFAVCFGKAESGGCNTVGDASANQDKIDDHVAGVVGDLNIASCNCCSSLPSLLALTSLGSDGTSTGSVSPATCQDGTPCSSDADCLDGSQCLGELRGGTLYAGGGTGAYPERPIPYLAASYLKIATCTGSNPDLTPTTAADVAGVGSVCATPSGTPTWGERHCTSPGCYVGAPVDIGTGDACGVNTIASVVGAGTGTLTCATGAMSVSLPLNKTAHSGFCPKCVGGTLGVCGSGTCSGGLRNGLACTPESKEGTSLDCLPSTSGFGSVIIGQGGGTTGTESLNAGPTSLFTNLFCGHCSANNSIACTTDAACTGFGSCTTHSNGAFGRLNAASISETGSAPGVCVAAGSHPINLVDVGCVPRSTAGVINSSAGLPGPFASSVRGAIAIIP